MSERFCFTVEYRRIPHVRYLNDSYTRAGEQFFYKGKHICGLPLERKWHKKYRPEQHATMIWMTDGRFFSGSRWREDGL